MSPAWVKASLLSCKFISFDAPIPAARKGPPGGQIRGESTNLLFPNVGALFISRDSRPSPVKNDDIQKSQERIPTWHCWLEVVTVSVWESCRYKLLSNAHTQNLPPQVRRMRCPGGEIAAPEWDVQFDTAGSTWRGHRWRRLFGKLRRVCCAGCQRGKLFQYILCLATYSYILNIPTKTMLKVFRNHYTCTYKYKEIENSFDNFLSLLS